MARHTVPAAIALVALVAVSAAGMAAHAQSDEAQAKIAGELTTLIDLVRSMGADVPELPEEAASQFNARLDAIIAQRAGADATALAKLDAQARAILAEYGLAALALAEERTPAVERASEFLVRLAGIHTAHAAALAVGAPPGEPGAQLDALYAAYGLRHSPAADAADSATPDEVVEITGSDGRAITLSGERATEFLRRVSALADRYATAHDTTSANRTAAIAAVEAEYSALYAEYGARFAPTSTPGAPATPAAPGAPATPAATPGAPATPAATPGAPVTPAAPGAPATPAAPATTDSIPSKVAGELDALADLVRSMGATVPELPDELASRFNARFDAIIEQRADADGAHRDLLDARINAIIAEYALTALAHAETRSTDTDRASEFLVRLAGTHARHAADLAAGELAGTAAADLDALYVEYGLRHVAEEEESDKSDDKSDGATFDRLDDKSDGATFDRLDDKSGPVAADETVELVDANGNAVTLVGERAAEFLRRADELSRRYAEAYDSEPADRAAAVAAVEAELRALYAEYGVTLEADPVSAPSGANDVGSARAADSMWETARPGEEYASLEPAPPAASQGQAPPPGSSAKAPDPPSSDPEDAPARP